MEKFEYKVIARNSMPQPALNRLGQDGWELVAVNDRGGYNLIVYYFKRRIL